MSVLSKSIRGAKLTGISLFVSSVLRLLQTLILSRLLSKEEFGIMGISMIFISFSEMFLDLGMSAGVLHRKDISNKEYSSIFWANMMMGGCVFLCLIILSPFISRYYHIDALLGVITLIGSSLVFSSVSKLSRTIQQKNMQFGFISLVDIVSVFISFLSSIVFAYFDFGVYSLVYSLLLSSFLVSAFYLYRIVTLDRIVLSHFNVSDLNPYLKIGVYQVGSSILDFFSREMDMMIISSSYSLSTIGAYTICKQFVGRLYGFLTVFNSKVGTPFFCKISEDIKAISSCYLQVTKGVSCIAVPVFFLLSVSSNDLILLLYGNQYQSYWMLLSVMFINASFLIIGNHIGCVQIALGRTDVGFSWTVYRIVSSALFMFLGSFYDMQVFILAILALNVMNMFVSYFFMYQRMLLFTFYDYISSISKGFIFSVFLWGISFFFINVLHVQLYFVLVFGFIFWLGFIYFFNPSYFKYFRNVVNRL